MEFIKKVALEGWSCSMRGVSYLLLVLCCALVAQPGRALP